MRISPETQRRPGLQMKPHNAGCAGREMSTPCVPKRPQAWVSVSSSFKGIEKSSLPISGSRANGRWRASSMRPRPGSRRGQTDRGGP